MSKYEELCDMLEGYPIIEKATVIKSYATKSGKTVAEVEQLWNKAKDLASEQYKDLTDKDNQYWMIVIGILKKMLGVEK